MTIFDIAVIRNKQAKAWQQRASEWQQVADDWQQIASEAMQLAEVVNQALVEERSLRQMVEAENAELVAQNMALKTEIADWVIGTDGDLRTRQLAAENAELTVRVQQLEAQLAYARHCGA